mmetsp:Transcript_41704/g.116231  ORF Transcript_41704/g.116231 Transcript_41704/m.116231 type:complete len:87 (-) Transcript_41704:190-450(-)
MKVQTAGCSGQRGHCTFMHMCLVRQLHQPLWSLSRECLKMRLCAEVASSCTEQVHQYFRERASTDQLLKFCADRCMRRSLGAHDFG